MIRPLRSGDARAVAEVQVRGWRWAYGDFIAPEDMPGLDEREARWVAGVPEGRAFVFDQDGRIVGVAGIGPARDDDADGLGELLMVYVDPPAQGAGVGGALLAHAERELRADGYAAAVLWVFEPNGHARGFCEHRGWRRDGARRPLLGTNEVRYRKAL